MSEDKTSGMIARANAEGGAAFPVSTALHWSPGMSLRDWFAGQAIQVITSNAYVVLGRDGIPTTTNAFSLPSPQEVAKQSYAIADAMLAERERTKPVEAKPGDDWTPHDGGPMPCDGNAMVDVRFRNGDENTDGYCALGWRWKHTGKYDDIIAWRYFKGDGE